MDADADFMPADWPAPAHVRAGTTTRRGGVSRGCHATLNLGDHVADDPATVAENRRILRATLALPAKPAWLQQVHGRAAVEAAPGAHKPQADASFARRPGVVCAIVTADCLPVLLCDASGTTVAGAHCGWRGLAGGVLAATLAAMRTPPDRLLAWLGPAIGPQAFEVGEDVRTAYLHRDAAHSHAFVATDTAGKYMANIYALARRELQKLGITQVYGGDRCTFTEASEFFSYRRDGSCGRMASLIWIED